LSAGKMVRESGTLRGRKWMTNKGRSTDAININGGIPPFKFK